MSRINEKHLDHESTNQLMPKPLNTNGLALELLLLAKRVEQLERDSKIQKDITPTIPTKWDIAKVVITILTAIGIITGIIFGILALALAIT